MRLIEDAYRCVSCGFIAAHGNSFCRDCGRKFSDGDVQEMKADVRSAFGASLYNLRDIYQCVHCNQHVAIEDKYCRGCGDQIDDSEKQLMKLRLDELARANTPALMVVMILVLAVVVVSALSVA